MPAARDALERKGPQRWPRKLVDRRFEEVSKAVGGDYCRLQMPLASGRQWLGIGWAPWMGGGSFFYEIFSRIFARTALWGQSNRQLPVVEPPVGQCTNQAIPCVTVPRAR